MSQEAAKEKDADEYAANENGQASSGTPSSDVNWLKLVATAQHLKELAVISAACGILIWLMFILNSLVSATVKLFTKAAELHSAPVKMIETMDWHVLGLGVSLIVGVSAVSIILMKSVFAGNGNKTPDGLNVSDLPLGELLDSFKKWWKS